MFDQLTADDFMDFLDRTTQAQNTRRGYIVVMKDFAKVVIKRKAANTNPFSEIKIPAVSEDVEYDRYPMTVVEFQKLMKHLDSFERYFMQKAKWTAFDRKLLYWTAVKTAYRQKELRALRIFNLYLDSTPPVICLKARHTKDGKKAEIGIPTALANELKKYIVGKDPSDLLFPMPATSGSTVDMLRRDLSGAGIVWDLPTGEVIDFHSLRSTAICWWLDEDKLPPKRVQVLARLKTLALVYSYSRNLRMGDFSWLDKGPQLVEETQNVAV